MKFLPIMLSSLTIFAVAGCSSRSPLESTVVPEVPTFVAGKPAPAPAAGLVVAASADKAVNKVGVPVDLNISVKNTSDKPITLNFPSGQSFEFQAFRPGETDAAWTWSMDKMFIMMIRAEVLEPGKSLEYKAQWESAPKGRYEIRGFINANGKLEAPRFQITVE